MQLKVSIADCYSYEKADLCEAKNGTYYLQSCYNETMAELYNITKNMSENVLKRPPAEEYFTWVTNCLMSIEFGRSQYYPLYF